MKFYRHLCLIFCIFISSIASSTDDPAAASNSDDSPNSVREYLQNFGYYLGYEIANPPENVPSNPPFNVLLNATSEQTLLTALVTSFFKAVPVSATNPEYSKFIAQGSDSMNLNDLANLTFSSYNTGSSGGASSTPVSANPLIDQQEFEADPVSQSILNILATPSTTNDSACSICTGTGCKPLCKNSVLNNVIGSIPSPDVFFKTDFNKQIVSQLNANVLIAPLLYSTTSQNQQSQTQGSSSNKGLQASTQAEQAANFIRYAIAGVNPTTLPSYTDYMKAFSATLETDSQGNATTSALNTQATIAQYFNELRAYAAQNSVAISNLYSILSRRLPQTASSGQAPTSAALTEFKMATWRINQPPSSDNKSTPQWIDQMNSATPAVVQKEMAILLAEINYQLYLNRQQQERILLTDSLILLQSTRAPEEKLTSTKEAAPTATPQPEE